METRHLKLIKHIVEQGSIVNAIDKLHLTSSALSYQLREAEWQFGTKIFYRIGKKLILTPAGEKLYESAKIILSELERVEKEVKSLIAGQKGVIRISTECYTSYHWLPSVLKRFNQQCPDIEVKVIFQATTKPLQKLLEGEIDLAITNDPIANDSIEFIELFKDEIWAVVAEEHQWTDKAFVNAEDFKNENLIIHSEPLETVLVYKKLLYPAGIEPKNITILPLTEASIELVKADMGVMVVPQWTIQHYIKAGEIRLVKLTPEGLYRHQYAALLKSESYPEYLNYFIKFLSEELIKK